MEKWELFEISSKNYLQKVVKINEVSFTNTGGSDSTSNDIVVSHKGNELFSVEAKLSPSQCGQFVLVLDDNKKFVLSERMRYTNIYTNQIINIIDTTYESEIPLLNLDLSQSMIANWVKEHYKHKGVEFIITSSGLNSFYAIIPISDVEKYFNFSGVLRRKRSGTRRVPKKDILNCIDVLKTHLNSNGILNYNIRNDGSTIYLILNSTSNCIGENLYFDKYFLSSENQQKYKVRVRANTNNLNVIFSLKYIGDKVNCGLEKIEKHIESVI
jgi:hypothetical protein